MDHKTKGKYGEAQAADFLIGQGFEILESNYRYGRGEIDLIALLQNVLLVFVEVKIRKNEVFGQPESFVTDAQQERIMQVAEHYMEAIHWQGDIRFDVIAINESSGELLHIRDGFGY
ncbi:MAG: YraN family protein [Cyclobacteriaceae bacterium]|nr:YraN family protein [Cyclobacteriaceae bacterium]